MKKLFKILFFLTGLIIAIIIAAVIAIPMYVDPNDYKEIIAEKVKEQTGRELSIAGDIGLSVFPWLGIDLGEVTLGNAPGFGDQAFAGVDKLQVHIKILPLLKNELEVSTAILHGLTLNLMRNKNGVSNWEDLTAGAAPSEQREHTSKRSEGLEIAAFAIGGLDLRDATISWDDQQAGKRYAINNLSVQTGAITGKDPVDFELEADLTSSQPAVSGHTRLAALLDADVENQQYRIEGLTLDINLLGETLPDGKLDANLSADIVADMAGQTLAISNMVFSTLGLNIAGELQATQLSGNPAFNATISASDFSPKQVLAAVGSTIATTDETVLSKANFQARLSGTANDLSLEQLDIVLDDTSITGHARVTGADKKAIRFDVSVDRIDVDRYLPPSAAQQAGGTPAAGATAAATELPMDMLRELDINGKIQIGELKVAKANLQSVTLTLRAKDGLIKINPMNARLYDGLYTGNLGLDVRGDVPIISAEEKLSGVQAGPLLADLTGSDKILGTANMNGKITARGIDDASIRRSLNGTVDFEFLDGAVNGVNISRMIRDAKAKMKGQSLPPDDGANQTDFSELTGSLNIKNGQVRNNDLAAKSPLLRIGGKGNADIVKETVDYLLQVAIVGTSKGQGGADLADLENVTIPIKITGTFTEPKYGLDMESLLKSQANTKIQETIERKLGDKLPGDLGDSLKGLFGR